MNLQPLIDAAALWLGWEPWKWLVFALVVWHVMIGRKNAVRWVEAFGWDGVLGLLTRIGWVQQPPPPPAHPEKTAAAVELYPSVKPGRAGP